jgi:hypothetical protein
MAWSQGNYVIDAFGSATGNADEAYLTSHECDMWEQVARYCGELPWHDTWRLRARVSSDSACPLVRPAV